MPVYGTTFTSPKYTSLEQGFLIYDVIEKYESHCLRLSWRQAMEATWRYVDCNGGDNFKAFVWAANHADQEWARKALRGFQHRIRYGDFGRVEALTPWGMSQELAEQIHFRNFQRLLKVCHQYRLCTVSALCDVCGGTGMPSGRVTCFKCGGCGTETVRDGCDWDKVANTFWLEHPSPWLFGR